MIKNFLKNTAVWGLFLVPFIPFIVAGSMFFPFITAKGFAFRILIEVIFGIYLYLAIVYPEFRPKFSLVTKSVIFFVAVVLIADLLGENVYKSIWSNYERMEGFVLIAHLFLYYLVTSSLFDINKWRQFFNVSIGTSALMSLYGLFQILGKATINQGGVRVDGKFGNASYLAVYLIFHIFLCLYMFAISEKSAWRKWAYGVIALFETVILYFTATRGAILGLIGGLVLWGLMIIWKERENKLLRRVSIGVFCALVVIVITFFAVRNTDYVKHNPVLSRFSTLSPSEFKNQGRYYVWPMAFKGFIERPIFGWGQENFNFVFNKYYDPRMYAQEQWFDRTHDIFLDWLIAAGGVGLIAYLSMYAVFLYYVLSRKTNLSLGERSVLVAMIAAYFFHNIFVFDNLISYIFFFSALSFVHVLSKDRLNSGTEVVTSFYTKIIVSEGSRYVVGFVVVVLAAGSIYFVNVPALSANKTLIKAMSNQQQGLTKNLEYFKKVYAYNSFGSTEATEQITQIAPQVLSANVDLGVKTGFYELAREQIEKKVEQVPNDARYRMFAGNFYNRTSHPDQAIIHLEKAMDLTPNKQGVYFELATSYLAKGNSSKMMELFKQAYELEPSSHESRVIYLVGSIYTRNSTVFKEMSKYLTEDQINSDDRILKAYFDISDYNSAFKILNARVVKDPNNIQTQLSLASAYASTGQKQTAINIIRNIITKNPSFKTQGETYIKEIETK